MMSVKDRIAMLKAKDAANTQAKNEKSPTSSTSNQRKSLGNRTSDANLSTTTINELKISKEPRNRHSIQHVGLTNSFIVSQEHLKNNQNNTSSLTEQSNGNPFMPHAETLHEKVNNSPNATFKNDISGEAVSAESFLDKPHSVNGGEIMLQNVVKETVHPQIETINVHQITPQNAMETRLDNDDSVKGKKTFDDVDIPNQQIEEKEKISSEKEEGGANINKSNDRFHTKIEIKLDNNPSDETQGSLQKEKSLQARPLPQPESTPVEVLQPLVITVDVSQPQCIQVEASDPQVTPANIPESLSITHPEVTPLNAPNIQVTAVDVPELQSTAVDVPESLTAPIDVSVVQSDSKLKVTAPGEPVVHPQALTVDAPQLQSIPVDVPLPQNISVDASESQSTTVEPHPKVTSVDVPHPQVDTPQQQSTAVDPSTEVKKPLTMAEKIAAMKAKSLMNSPPIQPIVNSRASMKFKSPPINLVPTTATPSDGKDSETAVENNLTEKKLNEDDKITESVTNGGNVNKKSSIADKIAALKTKSPDVRPTSSSKVETFGGERTNVRKLGQNLAGIQFAPGARPVSMAVSSSRTSNEMFTTPQKNAEPEGESSRPNVKRLGQRLAGFNPFGPPPVGGMRPVSMNLDLVEKKSSTDATIGQIEHANMKRPTITASRKKKHHNASKSTIESFQTTSSDSKAIESTISSNIILTETITISSLSTNELIDTKEEVKIDLNSVSTKPDDMKDVITSQELKIESEI